MRNLFSSFVRDESGAAAAEYALILAALVVGIALAFTNLGTAISDSLKSTGDTIKTPPKP